MENVLKKYNVSRETIDALRTFQSLVLEWNNKFNLISKSSEQNIWERHIIDSAQLYQFINNSAESLYDFGSGAGFPGVVLAIIAKEKNKNLKITLIESITKKTAFLNEVKDVLNININVINERIENLRLPTADIITSRAMSSLDKLLNYSISFTSKKTKLIFPKGEKWEEEIIKAKEKWVFDYKTIPSETNKEARILYIENIRRK